eukprot:5093511-Pleurochrysis_carterae.AAC.1
MEKYVCVQLRRMVDGFMATHGPPPVAPGSFKLLSPQELVQVDYSAPADYSSTQTTQASSSLQDSVRGAVGSV